MKLRTWLAVGAVAILAALAGYHFGQSDQKGPGSGASLLNPLLAAPLIGLDGQTKKLSDWRGKLLVINFWATWCPPCREEMPELSNYQERLGEGQVQFIGVAIDDLESVKAHAHSTPVHYPLLTGTPDLLAMTGKLGNANQGLPFTLVVDREGRLLWSKLGRLSERELDQQLLPLLSKH